MNIGKVVGFKNVDYTSKKNGKHIIGTQVNIVYQVEGVKGLEIGSFYVSADAPEHEEVTGLKLDEHIRFVTSYQFGRFSIVYVGKDNK